MKNAIAVISILLGATQALPGVAVRCNDGECGAPPSTTTPQCSTVVSTVYSTVYQPVVTTQETTKYCTTTQYQTLTTATPVTQPVSTCTQYVTVNQVTEKTVDRPHPQVSLMTAYTTMYERCPTALPPTPCEECEEPPAPCDGCEESNYYASVQGPALNGTSAAPGPNSTSPYTLSAWVQSTSAAKLSAY
ncbi:hypothetical protein F4778DRAFT_751164 [Xylariomycetidae sp. FL2044]|nr:hypothetical protein F4778DRAFT_751164 [Xylariomycetidae sp. FL2044]